MTRLGEILLFVQAFKAVGSNYLPQWPSLLGNFSKGVKIIHVSSEFIFGQLYRRFLAIFSGHTGRRRSCEGKNKQKKRWKGELKKFNGRQNITYAFFRKRICLFGDRFKLDHFVLLICVDHCQ